MKEILKVSFVVIGTMIGAGFASGQEIALFFNKYGNLGIIGIILSCSITGFIISKVFKIITKNNINNYSQFLEKLNSNKKINQILQIIINLFLLISFYIMVAGFCAYFKQEFQIPIPLTAIIISILCYITFKKDQKGIITINTFLIPILILFILFLGIKNLPFNIQYFNQTENIQLIQNNIFPFLISSILYASYNSIILIPILIELRKQIKNTKNIRKISILCSIILTILGIIIFSLLLRGTNYTLELELPMIQITKEFGTYYPILYGCVIIAAIFTSAISAGYGFLKNTQKSKKQYQKLVTILCLSSILIAPIGFSNLVSLLYPVFGILGLLQMFFITKYNKN